MPAYFINLSYRSSFSAVYIHEIQPRMKGRKKKCEYCRRWCYSTLPGMLQRKWIKCLKKCSKWITYNMYTLNSISVVERKLLSLVNRRREHEYTNRHRTMVNTKYKFYFSLPSTFFAISKFTLIKDLFKSVAKRVCSKDIPQPEAHMWTAQKAPERRLTSSPASCEQSINQQIFTKTHFRSENTEPPKYYLPTRAELDSTQPKISFEKTVWLATNLKKVTKCFEKQAQKYRHQNSRLETFFQVFAIILEYSRMLTLSLDVKFFRRQKFY